MVVQKRVSMLCGIKFRFRFTVSADVPDYVRSLSVRHGADYQKLLGYHTNVLHDINSEIVISRENSAAKAKKAGKLAGS